MFENLKSMLATSGEHLGDLCWWALSDAAILREALEFQWNAAQLPKELLPDPPTAERAFKAAVREAGTGQHNRLLRLGKEDEGEIVFAIVREERDSIGNVTHSQEARIVLSRTHETVGSDSPQHELVQQIVAGYTRLRNVHTADDVRRAVVKALHHFNAITLRDHGGVYWVPRTYAPQLRNLKTAVESIGKSAVWVLPIHKSGDASQTLGTVARGAIEEELAALQAEIEAFVAAPPERASTLARRFDAFEALRQKASLYRSILSVEVTDLDAQLDMLTSTVESLLHTKQAA